MTDTNYMAEIGPALVAARWPIVPIVAGEKRPGIPEWQRVTQATREMVAEWSRTCPGIGILTGHIVAIDIDVRRADIADAIHARLSFLLGQAPWRVGRAPKRLLVYRIEGQPVRKSHTGVYLDADETTHAVEVLGDGQQFVAYGIHPDTGQPYDWPGQQLDEIAPDDLPEIDTDGIAMVLDECRQVFAEFGLAPATRGHLPITDSIAGSSSVEAGSVIRDGARNSSLFRHACLLRSWGGTHAEILAMIETMNRDRVVPPLSGNELYTIAKQAAKYEPDAVKSAVVTGNVEALWGDPDDQAVDVGPHHPGPFPDRLLDVPGLMGSFMAYTLATSFRPQPVLALGAAIALQAVLAGRKVRDPAGNRTNVYVVAVAPSGAGKERPRQVLKRILRDVERGNLVGAEDFASESGLLRQMETYQSRVFLLDEIGRMLQAIRDAKSAPHLQGISSLLIKLYSSAGDVYYGKAYADIKQTVKIEQPCACLYGSTVPENYYQSLTTASLEDGFVARIMVLEAGDAPRQRPAEVDVPGEILDAANWWGGWWERDGRDLLRVSPDPQVVPETEEAVEVWRDLAVEVDEARRAGSRESRAVWSRIEQQAQKLALIYACSRAPSAELVIDQAAARWGAELAVYCAMWTLYQAARWVSQSTYHAGLQRIVRIVEAAGGSMTRRELHRSIIGVPARDRDAQIAELLSQGILRSEECRTGQRGRPSVVYRTGTTGGLRTA